VVKHTRQQRGAPSRWKERKRTVARSVVSWTTRVSTGDTAPGWLHEITRSPTVEISVPEDVQPTQRAVRVVRVGERI
jgi:hypothetical protein